MSTRTRLAIAGILSGACLSAQALPVTYLATDNSVSSLAQMVNSSAAAAAFIAAAGSLKTVDFESALPSGITITGGTRTNTSFCGAVCGFNTTPGGAFFQEIFGGSITFSFSTPVEAFGFYVNGLQTETVEQQTIVYVDGSAISRTINMSTATGGGGAFVGFIDQAQKISSVTFNGTSDVLGFDDLRFSQTTDVPEPATLALLGVALAGLASTRRRGRGSPPESSPAREPRGPCYISPPTT